MNGITVTKLINLIGINSYIQVYFIKEKKKCVCLKFDFQMGHALFCHRPKSVNNNLFTEGKEELSVLQYSTSRQGMHASSTAEQNG